MIRMITREAADHLHRAAIGRQKRMQVDAIARKHRPRLSAFFRTQKTLTLEKFKDYQFLFTEEYRALREEVRPNEFLTTHDWDRLWQGVDQDTFDELQRLVAGVESEGMLQGGKQLQNLINPNGKFWDLKNPRAVQWFQQNGGSIQYIKGIQATTSDQIKKIIVNAIDTGQSYGETAKEISATFDGMSRDRAQKIAVHESAQAYEAGNRMFADSLTDDGVVMEKMWENSGDDRVSDGCLENTADGWIPIDQPHSSGHQQPPRFPGCRCWEIYREAQ